MIEKLDISTDEIGFISAVFIMAFGVFAICVWCL
jgi:hypothetical protein